MATTITALFTENGDPIIPPEWGAIPEFQRLTGQHNANYIKVIVLLNAYRSPYRNGAKNLSYKERVEKLFEDWAGRWSASFKPKKEVLTTDVYIKAQERFMASIYDPLWNKLVVYERKEAAIMEAINAMEFQGSGLEEQASSLLGDEEEGEEGYGAKKGGKYNKPKSAAYMTAELVKAQGAALETLMKNLKMLSGETELLRSQLWREVKANRTFRASSIMESL